MGILVGLPISWLVRYRATHGIIILSYMGLSDNRAPISYLYTLRKIMKKVFVEILDDILVPLAILLLAMVVAAAYYALLAYVAIVKILLRELFLSLQPETKIEVEPKVEVEPKPIIKDEPEVKLATSEQVKGYIKPLGVTELRKMAQAARIKGARNMRKADLLTALEIR
jgi:hypothetical protein